MAVKQSASRSLNAFKSVNSSRSLRTRALIEMQARLADVTLRYRVCSVRSVCPPAALCQVNSEDTHLSHTGIWAFCSVRAVKVLKGCLLQTTGCHKPVNWNYDIFLCCSCCDPDMLISQRFTSAKYTINSV